MVRSEEFRAACSERKKLWWSNPQRRAEMSRVSRERWENPEQRRRMVESLRAAQSGRRSTFVLDTERDYVLIPLGNGGTTIVDREDAVRVMPYSWQYIKRPKDRTAYAQARMNRKIIKLHRFILGTLAGIEVDHINHDGLDNRKANLRECTRRQNAQNRPVARGRKYKGVTHLAGGKWRVGIRVGGKTVHVGVFQDQVSAALAYDQAARKHHGKFALCNFPSLDQMQGKP